MQQEQTLSEDQMRLQRPGKQTFSHSRGMPPGTELRQRFNFDKRSDSIFACRFLVYLFFPFRKQEFTVRVQFQRDQDGEVQRKRFREKTQSNLLPASRS